MNHVIKINEKWSPHALPLVEISQTIVRIFYCFFVLFNFSILYAITNNLYPLISATISSKNIYSIINHVINALWYWTMNIKCWIFLLFKTTKEKNDHFYRKQMLTKLMQMLYYYILIIFQEPETWRNILFQVLLYLQLLLLVTNSRHMILSLKNLWYVCHF